MDIKQKLSDFITQNNNKLVEVEDPNNKYQCFDLAFAWVDALGIPRDSIRHLYAYEIYTKPTDSTVKHFEIIPNTSNGVPIAGDIVVFDKKKNGTAGHVAIATDGSDINKCAVFEQNDSSGSNTSLKSVLDKHDYTYILGWLRPRISGDSQDSVIAAIAERDKAVQDLTNGRKEWTEKERSKNLIIEQTQKSLSLANENMASNIKNMSVQLSTLSQIVDNISEYQRNEKAELLEKIKNQPPTVTPTPTQPQLDSTKLEKLLKFIKVWG